MRKIILLVLMLFAALSYAQIGININPPHTSAALDITSTSAGFLPPRMTALQRAEIVNPALGLMVFCTNCASGDGELQVYYVSGWKNAAGGDITDPPPVVGDYYQGGVVFYILQSGDKGYATGETHGLIAAVVDQSSSIQWYNGSNITTTATGTAIGTGTANTDAIINVQGVTATSYAAGLARAYDGGEYNDWFLPSKDELNLMYQNRETINTTALANSGSLFNDNWYWSSTEVDSENAASTKFSDDLETTGNKHLSINMRAVRAF